jgi:hypothetical protein
VNKPSQQVSALPTPSSRRWSNGSSSLEQRLERFTSEGGKEIHHAVERERLTANAKLETATRDLSRHVEQAATESRRATDAKLTAMEQRLEQRLVAVPGRLPPVKAWEATMVVYAGELASLDGALWQARKDTGQRPGGPDWICVASAGRDAVTPTIRGTYEKSATYKHLDIVVCDGGAFIAKRDNPGICPSSGGWQMMARQGKSGRPGSSGPRGPRGLDGLRGEKGIVPQLVSSEINEAYELTLTRADGSKETIPLRQAFEFYHRESSEVLLAELNELKEQVERLSRP